MSNIFEKFKLPETERYVEKLQEVTGVLKSHPIYKEVKSRQDLQVFMQMHVYAVWDFMVLLKRIQSEYTGYRYPWTPPVDAASARLINQIVLSEESEQIEPGVVMSHFELYQAAMEEVGASRDKIDAFIMNMRFGVPPDAGIATVFENQDDEMRQDIMNYVCSTVRVATKGTIEQALAYFLFGREDPIPSMFQSLLDNMSELKEKAPLFVKYLELHVWLDGEEHGKAATQLLVNELKGNPTRTINMLQAAIEAVNARIALWDAVLVQIEKQRTISA